jgi:hypothetical protein
VLEGGLRERPGVGDLGLQALFSGAEPGTARRGVGQLGRQLVAAALTEALVVAGVGFGGLGEDLAGDLLVAAVGAHRRVGLDLGAVQRDHADRHQARLGAEAEDLAEQVTERVLVADAEACDRRVIGRMVGGDDAERDILVAAALDPPRRSFSNRVGVQQQREHHRRIKRRAAPAVVAVAGQERSQVEFVDDLEHEPRQVIVGQPLPQAWRQQQGLLPITRHEVMGHHQILPPEPDKTTV